MLALGSAVALLVISTAILLWARTRPGFDPYGWLVWGHQTVAGNLNTNAAPSWKPLPFLFTAPYGLFGHYQLWLWMITSLAISLGGALFAGRIAYRLTGVGPERRYAAYAAAVFAGLALLGISDYWHYMLSAQSDPMIVTLCLAAIDCHLSGRPRWAFVCGALAALGRPEVWLFLGLYSIWAWRAIPSMRWLIVTGIVLVVLLWFGIPALTSRSPFVAGSNALGSGRRLRSDRVLGTIGRFLDLSPTVLELTALLAVALAVVRRHRVTLVLVAGVCVWVIVEIAFSLHGWPGLGRYMFEPAAVVIALAGVAIGRLLADPPRISSLATWLGIALVVVIVGALVPPAVSHARNAHRDIRAQRVRTAQIGTLSSVVARLAGPARFKACGEPLTRLEYQTVLAWILHLNVAKVGYKYGPAIAGGRPIVLFTPLSHGGWRVQALHQRLPGCRSLPR
ncbi:MAG: hypothetical protein JO286_20795 [Solirubrobacterales bacterium]|nr:hypothetical protein [Solirubrobacterales bacterium]